MEIDTTGSVVAAALDELMRAGRGELAGADAAARDAIIRRQLLAVRGSGQSIYDVAAGLDVAVGAVAAVRMTMIAEGELRQPAYLQDQEPVSDEPEPGGVVDRRPTPPAADEQPDRTPPPGSVDAWEPPGVTEADMSFDLPDDGRDAAASPFGPATVNPLTVPDASAPQANAAPGTISNEEFEAMCDIARSLNEYHPATKPVRPLRAAGTEPGGAGGDGRPGDDFNCRGEWADILEPHGWRSVRRSGYVTYWTRPGKDPRDGHSATTGYCEGDQLGDLLYVFTSNADPLEMETPYSKFAAHALHNHGGDFAAAARDLRKKGFGGAGGRRTGPVGDAAAGRSDDTNGDAGKATPLLLAETDIGNGCRFVTDHGHAVRYVDDMKTWAVYDGRRWELDKDGKRAEGLAKETAKRMAAEAAAEVKDAVSELTEAAAANDGEGDEEAKKRATARQAAAKRRLGWAIKTHSTKGYRAMLTAAESEPAVFVRRGDDLFDRHPHLLNCPNGTIDLRTGDVRPHDRADFLTKPCPTAYRRDATVPRFQRFLLELFPDQPENADYVRRLLGYVVTGEVTDQAYYLFDGGGSNGKTLLLETAQAVLGDDYVYTVPPEVLMDGSGSRHPTERVGFRGARLAVAEETEEEGTLNESRIKQLTGGGTMTGRFCNRDFFSFNPTHTLFLATNHRPSIRGTDDGTWRRPRLIRFTAWFYRQEDAAAQPERVKDANAKPADPTLKDKLPTEAEGILADMVRQAVAFYFGGGVVTAPPAWSRRWRSTGRSRTPSASSSTGASARPPPPSPLRSCTGTTGRSSKPRSTPDPPGRGSSASGLRSVSTATARPGWCTSPASSRTGRRVRRVPLVTSVIGVMACKGINLAHPPNPPTPAAVVRVPTTPCSATNRDVRPVTDPGVLTVAADHTPPRPDRWHLTFEPSAGAVRVRHLLKHAARLGLRWVRVSDSPAADVGIPMSPVARIPAAVDARPEEPPSGNLRNSRKP
jgi:P4 family phage/plasmid primase-like protien